MSTLVKDASGNVISTPAWDANYGASVSAIAYVTAKCVAQLKGPTSGVARVKRVTVTLASGGTAGDAIVQIVKQSTANTAQSTATATPLNSTENAATCVFSSSDGTSLGTVTGTAIRSQRLCVTAAAGASAAQTAVFDFSRNMDQAPVLNSASEYLGVKFLAGTTAPASSVVDVDIEWEEASA